MEEERAKKHRVQRENGEKRAERENREEMQERVRWAAVEDDGCVGGREICRDPGGSIWVEMQSEDEERRSAKRLREGRQQEEAETQDRGERRSTGAEGEMIRRLGQEEREQGKHEKECRETENEEGGRQCAVKQRSEQQWQGKRGEICEAAKDDWQATQQWQDEQREMADGDR